MRRLDGHETKGTYSSLRFRTLIRGHDMTLEWENRKTSPLSRKLLCGNNMAMKWKERNLCDGHECYHAKKTWTLNKRTRNLQNSPEREHAERLPPWRSSVYWDKGPRSFRKANLNLTPFLFLFPLFSSASPLYVFVLLPFHHYSTALELQNATLF